MEEVLHGEELIVLLTIVWLVFFVLAIGKTSAGKKIFHYLPAPFWIYFLSILLGTLGFLPHQSPFYGRLTLWVLPAALFLLLIGTPIKSLFKIGPKALLAMGLATVSMFIGVILSYLLFGDSLSDEGWKMSGTMLGTWTGGSANMAAVKEIVELSDAGMAPLILIDTFLSYGWLALLIVGAGFQVWFDRGKKMISEKTKKVSQKKKSNIYQVALAGIIPFILVFILLFVSDSLVSFVGVLSKKAWVIILTSLIAISLSNTKVSKLEDWGASKTGTFFLYCVLASYGAKTSFNDISGVVPFFVFGLIALLIHGSVLFGVGRMFKVPLVLLATASQANIGGPVSAPIVAGVYQPGSAHIGVLMAILGATLGTYIGALGGWICRLLG